MLPLRAAENHITDPEYTRNEEFVWRTDEGCREAMKPSHINAGTTETLGTKLERDRLTRRARRVTAVIAARAHETPHRVLQLAAAPGIADLAVERMQRLVRPWNGDR
jgi:hypothetical protein